MHRHAERRPLNHTPEQLFDLVADVDRYPEFLPWCTGVRVRQRSETMLVADLIIGFKGVSERFTSRVHLDRANMEIAVSYEKGPFKYLKNHWKFEATEQGCVVDFFVEFEFRSRILEKLIGMVFTEAVRKMVTAFETRADALYGGPKTSAG